MVSWMFSSRGVSKLHFVPSGCTNWESILAKEGYGALNRRDNFGPIVSRKIVPAMSRAIFIQDSAPPHCTIHNYKWMDQHFLQYYKKGEWPGNSPKLNAIENLWAILKEEVNKLPSQATLDGLKKQLKRTWEKLSPMLLQNLCLSMPRTLQAELEKKGEATGY